MRFDETKIASAKRDIFKTSGCYVGLFSFDGNQL
jgi:hypothetical protein